MGRAGQNGTGHSVTRRAGRSVAWRWGWYEMKIDRTVLFVPYD